YFWVSGTQLGAKPPWVGTYQPADAGRLPLNPLLAPFAHCPQPLLLAPRSSALDAHAFGGKNLAASCGSTVTDKACLLQGRSSIHLRGQRTVSAMPPLR